MAFWIKLEKWKITEWKDGCIFKTKKVGHDWFRCESQPETNVHDRDGVMWIATLENRVCKDKPTD